MNSGERFSAETARLNSCVSREDSSSSELESIESTVRPIFHLTGTKFAELCCDVAPGCLRPGRRDVFSRATQAFYVEFDGIVHLALDFLARTCRSNTSRQIGRISRITCRRLLDNNQIAGHLSPACSKYCFSCLAQARLRASRQWQPSPVCSDVCIGDDCRGCGRGTSRLL